MTKTKQNSIWNFEIGNWNLFVIWNLNIGIYSGLLKKV